MFEEVRLLREISGAQLTGDLSAAEAKSRSCARAGPCQSSSKHYNCAVNSLPSPFARRSFGHRLSVNFELGGGSDWSEIRAASKAGSCERIYLSSSSCVRDLYKIFRSFQLTSLLSSRPSENDSKVVAMDVDKPSSAPAPTSSTDSYVLSLRIL